MAYRGIGPIPKKAGEFVEGNKDESDNATRPGTYSPAQVTKMNSIWMPFLGSLEHEEYLRTNTRMLGIPTCKPNLLVIDPTLVYPKEFKEAEPDNKPIIWCDGCKKHLTKKDGTLGDGINYFIHKRGCGDDKQDYCESCIPKAVKQASDIARVRQR